MGRPQVKGRVLIDTVTLVRERYGEEGWSSLVAALDGETQELLRGSLLANAWYPLDVLTAVMAADVRMFLAGDESVIQARAEELIARQLGGIYRFFVRLGSPEFIIKRLGTIHATYFDGIGIAPIFDEGRRAVVRYTGFEPQHRMMERAILGFYRKALELSGAKDVALKVTTSIAAGTGVLEIEIGWS
jgi:hypothetical protein